ncbi:hypothetical protein PRIPAC_76149 [Pristionchus pacificus]|uniref:Uncharacterized protein n=1 Tax=Pristionchus pacificus TaxID=54126 RepID=A0A2A6CAA1_PRIPA|nr:hypothetical protein PRIPAC_76149 [Pristionchus pacificus]|eukprot:PDM75008.1 hypothetical protein PRIPAC_40389 [Pristionchus pacificus]
MAEYPGSWRRREDVIHSTVFDSLSRPLSRSSDRNQKQQQQQQQQELRRVDTHSLARSEPIDDMGLFNGNRVRWNHFGKKYTLRISDYEMEYADLYDAFMKKIYEVRPDFEGRIAFIDNYGRQSLISTDSELREALAAAGGKLKVHTMLTDGSVVAAADLVKSRRSQSVPPPQDRAYHTYPPNSRSPSSLQSAPIQPYRRRTLTPPPVIESPTSASKGPVVPYHQMQVPPPGYTYKYTTYGPSYTQPILYGMPPTNGMLMRFLLNPYSMGYTRSWVGPYKYGHWGGWNGRYATSGWGPIW